MYPMRQKDAVHNVRAKIVQVGNATGLRIPKAFLVELGLERESEVELASDGARLVVTPVRGARDGWAAAFARASETTALDPHASTKFDEDEWSW